MFHKLLKNQIRPTQAEYELQVHRDFNINIQTF